MYSAVLLRDKKFGQICHIVIALNIFNLKLHLFQVLKFSFSNSRIINNSNEIDCFFTTKNIFLTCHVDVASNSIEMTTVTPFAPITRPQCIFIANTITIKGLGWKRTFVISRMTPLIKSRYTPQFQQHILWERASAKDRKTFRVGPYIVHTLESTSLLYLLLLSQAKSHEDLQSLADL